MISIKINNVEFFVKKNISVLEACRYVGIFIPRFCYHEKLSIAGNCRMCLVDNGIKLVSSCTAVVEDTAQVFTDSPMVKKARENVIESLLLNHPLDCPICDQAGECDLQDQTKIFGGDYSRFFMSKRGVEDKECGPLIKTIMTRCIHCTRCVRFGTEVAGVDYFGTLNRGGSTEIGNYIPKLFDSEVSGNVIDLCPVGALTSKPYAFKARPWELRITESIDLSDSLGSNTYLNFKETEVVRILPKNNVNLNENWISDKARFSYDALKTQRIQQPLIKKGANLSKTNWLEAFNSLNKTINEEKTIFIFDEDLDLTSMNILKKIQRKNPKNVNLACISTTNEYKNYYDNFLNNKLIEINKNIINCFVISSNVKLESAILNTRLKSKFINETFNLVSLGLNVKTNIPTNIINLNLNSILNVFEGKSIKLSKLFVKEKNPLIIFGTSFKQRFKNIEILKSSIKKIMPTTIFLTLEERSNTKGRSLTGNLNSLNQNLLNNSKNAVFVNVENSTKTYSMVNNFKGKIFWINTHYSDVLNKVTDGYILPALSYYEDENLFLNLEEKAQKTLKGISGPSQAKSIRKFFANLFGKKTASKSFSFLNEKISNSTITVKNSVARDLNSLENFTEFSKHPFKSNIEDFYRTNNFLKNSPLMAECSQEVRKNSTNF